MTRSFQTPPDPLTAVPDLIAQAHDLLVISVVQADPDVDALLTDLELCFLAAHRLLRRLRAGPRPTDWRSN